MKTSTSWPLSVTIVLGLLLAGLPGDNAHSAGHPQEPEAADATLAAARLPDAQAILSDHRAAGLPLSAFSVPAAGRVGSESRAAAPSLASAVPSGGTTTRVSVAGDFVYGAASKNILYVKHDAIGNSDGSSWIDAYTDLQDALGAAQTGDEIWVAQGIYYPAADALDRTATFELRDGVGLYGGFAGTETERAERDWETNVTVLSGDLDRNDTTDENGVVTDTVGILGRNAYHVMMTDSVTETTILDGFALTAGLADGPEEEQTCGGGMYNNESSPTLTNVTFSGNQASRGGGVYNQTGNPVLTYVTFSDNQGDSGGGMYNTGGHPTLSHVNFTANQAAGGGGMYNLSSSTLTNVTFIENVAETGTLVASSGGGMLDSGDSTLTSVTFTDNRADWGGGMYASGNAVLVDVTFDRNIGRVVQAGRGGGVHANGGSPVLTNAIFTANEAGSEGGGMYATGGSPVLNNVTFNGNYAGYGGGMSSSGASPTLTDVLFMRNQAGYDNGGGMYADGGSPELTNVTFVGNQAEEHGGGMYNDAATSTLTNVALSGNQTNEGGGIYNRAGDIQLVNLTLAGNWAESTGGGVYNEDSSPILANCILWGNAALTSTQIHNEGTSAPYVIYSDIEGGHSGEGNIDVDPLFVDPISASQAPTTTGNYRLTETSPAVDAGTNHVVTVTTDLEGKPRFIDIPSVPDTGNGTPPIVDMGAYEAQLHPVGGVTISGPITGSVENPYTFTATVDPIEATLPITYVWQATQQPSVTHASEFTITDSVEFMWTTPGTHVVTSIVSNAGGQVASSHAITICERVDVVCDCVIDIADIQTVAGRWRCADGDGCYDARYDQDGDGVITVVDIMQVAAEWGWSCP